MSERLVRVERFEELGAGMKVVIKHCGWCGADHEAFLLNLRTIDDVEGPKGSSGTSTGWETADNPPCARPETPGVLLTWESVAGGFVYRVLDGVAPSTETAGDETKRHVKENAS